MVSWMKTCWLHLMQNVEVTHLDLSLPIVAVTGGLHFPNNSLQKRERALFILSSFRTSIALRLASSRSFVCCIVMVSLTFRLTISAKNGCSCGCGCSGGCCGSVIISSRFWICVSGDAVLHNFLCEVASSEVARKPITWVGSSSVLADLTNTNVRNRE